MKKCNTCNQIKPDTQFAYHPRTKDGLFNQCKACFSTGHLRSGYTIRRHKEGHVYLFWAENGLCKIGVALDLETRLRQMQLLSPVAISKLASCRIQRPKVLEQQLHRLFDGHHSHGEWFLLSQEQIEQAKEMIWQEAQPATDYQH